VADFKGAFKLGNGRYYDPHTVTDRAARFLLLCEALDITREDVCGAELRGLLAVQRLPPAMRA
jgi:hypothetical protein